MKRLTAIVMVLLLVAVGGSARADDLGEALGTVEEFATQMLTAYGELYDSDGADAFDENMVAMVYGYYKLYIDATLLRQKEEVRTGGYQPGGDAVGSLMNISTVILSQGEDTLYMSYLTGETEKDVFLSSTFDIFGTR